MVVLPIWRLVPALYEWLIIPSSTRCNARPSISASIFFSSCAGAPHHRRVSPHFLQPPLLVLTTNKRRSHVVSLFVGLYSAGAPQTRERWEQLALFMRIASSSASNSSASISGCARDRTISDSPLSICCRTATFVVCATRCRECRPHVPHVRRAVGGYGGDTRRRALRHTQSTRHRPAVYNPS